MADNPVCDSCGKPIKDGQRAWQRAFYNYDEVTASWVWHVNCPEPKFEVQE